MKRNPLLAGIGLALLLLIPAGCSVGPDYVRPPAVETLPATFKEADGWKLAQPREIAPAEAWWTIYGDPLLDALEAQVALSNQDIALAEARYRQAQALIGTARAERLPNLSAAASASRVRLSENADSGAIFTNYQVPIELGWELDLWGRVRRGVEAGRADAQAGAADLVAATLSARTQLANAYFQLRVADAQRALLEKTTAIYRKSLAISNARYAAGATTKVDVLQAETQLKSAEAQWIDLGVQRARLEHAVALLVGKPPADFALAPAALATEVPVVPAGLPSELLERRPDVAAAERRMAAANARIGLTQAAYYPTVRLAATGGFSSTALSSLFDWPSRFWSVGPAAALSLFDGGARKARTEAARAAYDGTVASYRGTVLKAFQEVEDNLAALRLLEHEAEVQSQALAGAREVVTIATQQYEVGALAYLNVLINQSIALENERTALDIHARRLGASVQLVKALGGDWRAEARP